MPDFTEDFRKQLEEQLSSMNIQEKKERVKRSVLSRPIENLINMVNVQINESEMEEDLTFATKKGLQELEELREAFLTFQEISSSLIIYKEVKSLVEELAETLSGLVRLLADDIDQSKLSQSAKDNYWLAQKTRARILAELYNFYYENNKEDSK